MKIRTKVRFNLSRGKNYMKWKVTSPQGVEYYSPTDTQIIMKGCNLKNNRKTALKIFNGEHKTVCAWVICDSVEIKTGEFVPYDIMDKTQLSYNPKVLPFWVIKDTEICMDGAHVKEIGTVDYKLFIIKN
jgi:hypothetical protein